jgi:hypothetical protein
MMWLFFGRMLYYSVACCAFDYNCYCDRHNSTAADGGSASTTTAAPCPRCIVDLLVVAVVSSFRILLSVAFSDFVARLVARHNDAFVPYRELEAWASVSPGKFIADVARVRFADDGELVNDDDAE